MTGNSGVRVAKCPIKQEYCYPSCYFRKGDRCCFRSKRGRQILGLGKETGRRQKREYRIPCIARQERADILVSIKECPKVI